MLRKDEETTTKKTVVINGYPFLATIANTPQEREQGLSGKDKLLQGEAMLFLFDDSKIRTFWMRDMKFDLDILFIRSSTSLTTGDEILEIATLKKPTDNKNIQSYTTKNKVDKVLEINAGMSEKLKIKVGDKIEIKD